MTEIDKRWHLSEEPVEAEIADFELQLWRVFYGFIGWQEECEKTVNNTDLTGNELAILHVIRLKDRPKTISDISRILNRNDTFNIHYSIRKLIKKKLVQKTVGGKAYEMTPEGIENTSAYARMRKNTLIKLYLNSQDLQLTDMAAKLAKLKSIYDDASQLVAISTSLDSKK